MSIKKKAPEKKINSKQIVTSEVATVLDRVNVSDRKATMVIAAVTKHLGNELEEVALSRSTVRRARKSNRQNYALQKRNDFVPSAPLFLHWDGKMLPGLTRVHADRENRVAVVVSWKNNEILLGAPHIPSGTGKDHANVCIELLYKWNIAEQVRGLVFDTTASNTGINTGACTLIEKALGRELVWVACRHHIMEIVLSSVFKAVMGDTTGPCVEVFKRFQSQWDVINKENFDLPDEADFQGIRHLREEAKETYTELFDTTFPRDDYREFLELCTIFVGGNKESYVFKEFRAPGGVSNARWMSKAIYAIKIVLFRRQFTLPLNYLKDLLLSLSL